MPQPRKLDKSDYPAAQAWLASHGHTGVLPYDADRYLDRDAWRALKAAVRAARHRVKASGGGPELDDLLQAVAIVGNTLAGTGRGLTRQQAGRYLLERLDDYQTGA